MIKYPVIFLMSAAKGTPSGKQNNEIRNIGIVVLILGVVGYVIPSARYWGLQESTQESMLLGTT